jgi:hypothetical protein
MSLVGFKPKTAVFERTKMGVIHALDRTATVINFRVDDKQKNKVCYSLQHLCKCHADVWKIFNSIQTSRLTNLICSNQSWKELILPQVRIPLDISVCIIFIIIIINRPSYRENLHPTHHTETLPHVSQHRPKIKRGLRTLEMIPRREPGKIWKMSQKKIL